MTTINLQTAITQQWQERFAHNPHYAKDKIDSTKKAKNTCELLHLCMNIDHTGQALIAKKLNFKNFKSFLHNFKALANDVNDYI